MIKMKYNTVAVFILNNSERAWGFVFLRRN